GLLTMATGTGKTRVAIALVELLMRANWVKRVLFLADRRALVKQATNAFKTHLPDSSPVNLCLDKDGQGRVFLSTYPTMMGLIESFEGEARRYGVGHFDLIIIDEAHRSVYQKYGAIFRYFDGLLIGLTATPRDEVDRDTYHLFGLETGVPTDAYGLDEAVADGYLVPPKAQSVPIRFVREGIRYDELSPEEKEHWESLDWGDREGGTPEEVSASEVNKQLFNESTVDLMLQHLMAHGLRVEGGDRLGKTIVFAVNQKHAEFIARRFDHHYPHHAGHFARVVTYAVNYAQSLIDDFSKRDGAPHLAISVDMLDTGIDVPEVLNLVFFKAVRSKVKFLQMIGRGTRLCPALFGPGDDKTEFAIFDFCGNFEYFDEHPAGAVSAMPEPLGKRLFKRRLALIELLPETGNLADEQPAFGEQAGLRDALIEALHAEVAAMNPNNFIVRPAVEHVTRFAQTEAWVHLDQNAFTDLRQDVAGLPSALDQGSLGARLFDLLCLNLQISLLQRTTEFVSLRDRLIEIASDLETKDSIPAVREQLVLIQAIQTEGWWQGLTAPLIEEARRRLRGLVDFVDPRSRAIVYTVLKDEIGTATEVTLENFSTGINLAQYRRKVESYIRKHTDHVAVAKLRFNRPLTATDLAELERLVYTAEAAENRERFEQCFGSERSLSALVRS
ncbi:MAG: DEAD/DEAH box helicase family protein, partial [Xanthomonadales bacterium]|nr:DEAD/DEAH box helicase family protein [Xanthomonadales bacterium]